MLVVEIFIGLLVVGLLAIIYRLVRWHNEDDSREP